MCQAPDAVKATWKNPPRVRHRHVHAGRWAPWCRRYSQQSRHDPAGPSSAPTPFGWENHGGARRRSPVDQWTVVCPAADGSSFAIVMTVTDPHADTYRASLIVVPTDTSGFHRRQHFLHGTCRRRPGDHVELVFDRRRVPAWRTCSARKGPEVRDGPGPPWVRVEIQYTMRWIAHSVDDMVTWAATRQLRRAIAIRN